MKPFLICFLLVAGCFAASPAFAQGVVPESQVAAVEFVQICDVTGCRIQPIRTVARMTANTVEAVAGVVANQGCGCGCANCTCSPAMAQGQRRHPVQSAASRAANATRNTVGRVRGTLHRVVFHRRH